MARWLPLLVATLLLALGAQARDLAGSDKRPCTDRNCAECPQHRTICTKCKPGYAADISVDTGLLPCRRPTATPKTCGQGFGLVNGDCKKCRTGCAACDGNASKCTRCLRGYKKSGSRCSALTANPRCADPNCARCRGSTSTCEECAAGYWADISVYTGLLPCRPTK